MDALTRPFSGGGDRQDGFIYCGGCENFDEPSSDFHSSNLRQCKATGGKRWIGDDARKCDEFTERCYSGVMGRMGG